MMTFKAEPVQKQLCSISHLGYVSYKTCDVFYLNLPVLPVVSFFPGDFRTVDEIKKDITENRKIGSYLLDPPISAVRFG